MHEYVDLKKNLGKLSQKEVKCVLLKIFSSSGCVVRLFPSS